MVAWLFKLMNTYSVQTVFRAKIHNLFIPILMNTYLSSQNKI